VGNDGSRPATVTVRLRNGETHTLHEDHPKGSRQVPMTDAELEAKFRDCARDVIDSASAERVLGYVGRLESLGDISPLCQLLMGPG
jgi:2-methylcitrate dehydratase PrpD